jgi:hypothetical protein
MDSPIDPVNKSTEYVGLPKVDPWHESEKHKKKRFAKMLEDQMEDQKNGLEERDEVELSSDHDDGEHAAAESPGPATSTPDDSPADDREPAPPVHIDLKG